MKPEQQNGESVIMEEETRGRAYTIFVVEDSDIYRMVLERFLSKMTNVDLSDKPDCEILSFASAEECLKMMEKKVPDIVVMDYFLNGKNGKSMGGLELLKEIKKRSPKTEVLVLSRQEDVLITAELFNQGASAYITKEPQGQNRVQNAVLETIKRIEKQKKESRNRMIILILVLILGIAIGAFVLGNSL